MNIQSPAVSVCIPTFNRAKSLNESIASVLDQTFADFELIISDNASDDGTESLVASLRDARIRYSRNPTNVGPRENMNRCLCLARGRYIAFLPDDDVMMPGNLREKVAVLDGNPKVGLVHSSFHLTDEAGRILKENTNWGHGPDRGFSTLENRLKILTAPYNVINLPTVLFRRSCYEKLGGFSAGLSGEFGLAFDYEFWLRIALYCDIAYLAKPLVKWRIHRGSLTNTRLGADETRKWEQVLAAKRFFLNQNARNIPVAWNKKIHEQLRQDIFNHVENLIAYRGPSRPARESLVRAARMFPDLLLRAKTWKLLVKAGLNRSAVDRLKRIMAI